MKPLCLHYIIKKTDAGDFVIVKFQISPDNFLNVLSDDSELQFDDDDTLAFMGHNSITIENNKALSRSKLHEEFNEIN